MPRMCCLVWMGGGPPSCPSTCGANLAIEIRASTARRSGEDAQELPTRRKVEKVLENLISQKIMRGIPPVRGIVVKRYHPEP